MPPLRLAHIEMRGVSKGSRARGDGSVPGTYLRQVSQGSPPPRGHLQRRAGTLTRHLPAKKYARARHGRRCCDHAYSLGCTCSSAWRCDEHDLEWHSKWEHEKGAAGGRAVNH